MSEPQDSNQPGNNELLTISKKFTNSRFVFTIYIVKASEGHLFVILDRVSAVFFNSLFLWMREEVIACILSSDLVLRCGEREQNSRWMRLYKKLVDFEISKGK